MDTCFLMTFYVSFFVVDLQTDVFIFDCDGVIWKGDSLIEGIPSVLDRLREAGKR